MKGLKDYLYISEARLSDKTPKPFTSREELMAFVDELEKTKLIIKKYEDAADKVYKEMERAQRAANKEFDKLGYDKLKGDEWSQKYDEVFRDKYDIDGYIKKADEIMKTPECVEANKKLYGELQQRALDSLSQREQKAIGKRGGRLYNILNEVMKKYMHYDFKNNKEV